MNRFKRRSILIWALFTVLFFSGCKKNGISLNSSSVYLGENILVRKVVFTGSTTGYACGGVKGSNGFIFKTSNGGQSWQQIYNSGSNELFDVFFVTDSTGFACGDNLTLLKTTTAGARWFSINANPLAYKCPVYPLKGIFFTDTLNGYVAGGAGFDLGLTLRTVNGGISWLYSTYPRELRDLYFSDAGNGFVCGYGIVMKTSDGDQSTSVANVVGDFFTSICTTPNQTLFVGGYAGGIYRSADGGATWAKVYSSGSNFNGVAFDSDLEGFAVGNNGVMVRTEDGGSTWKTVKPFTGYNLYTVCFLNPGYAGSQQIIVGSDQGKVYTVSDGN